MTFHVQSADSMRDIETFVRDNGLKKEDIISILQDADQNFVLSYFAD